MCENSAAVLKDRYNDELSLMHKITQASVLGKILVLYKI